MLKELFTNYQQNLGSDEAFIKLVKKLEPKILSIFKTINCNYSYLDDFKQECIIKIFSVAKMKHFDDTANSFVVDKYFTRAFKTVKQEFIKEYSINITTISINRENEKRSIFIDQIACFSNDEEKSSELLVIIKETLNESDYQFFLNFINTKNEIRSVTEVAKLINISHQAVSKRFNKIKRLLKDTFKNR